MIEFQAVTKRFDRTLAVDDLSFEAPPGAVTGFLGPNGAGKTTSLRVLLGLAQPDSGSARIAGSAYGALAAPRRTIGAVLDSMGFHPGRTGRDHLRVLARGAGLPGDRVAAVLGFVELSDAADRAAGEYSQGMRQRLALAGALLGDPPVLILDEPGNGLDPAGIAWLRRAMLAWASEGRTVLFASHILAEVEAVADRIVIIARGRVVAAGAIDSLFPAAATVVVRSADDPAIVRLAQRNGWGVRSDGAERLEIVGASARDIGTAAAAEGIALYELSSQARSGQLETMFLELTAAGARS